VTKTVYTIKKQINSMDILLLRQLSISKNVIPAKAGIQAGTGCRIKACPGLDPGSGITRLAYFIAGLIIEKKAV
jgi:hypothetical protein